MASRRDAPARTTAPARTRRTALPAPPSPPAIPAPLPDLRMLHAFATLCDAGSMVIAAERLGLSTSAISQTIRSLERDTGTLLLDRDTRPARPTVAGRMLLEECRPLLAQARAMAERVRGRARHERAQLRLGCVDSFAATVGPSLVRALSGTAMQLQLWSGLTPALASQMRARELDLAICTEPIADDDDIHLVRRTLCSEPWVLVLPRRGPRPVRNSPGARAAEQAPNLPASAGALAQRVGDLPLVRYSARSAIGRQVERYLRHLGLAPPRRYELDATDGLLALVAAGLGWAVSTPLCLWQSRALLAQVQVLPLPRVDGLSRREFHLVSHDGEWAGLDAEVARIVRQVITRELLPAMRRHLPLRDEGFGLD